MKWNWAVRVASPAVMFLALAACGNDVPTAKPSEQADTNLPALGREVRIVALGDSLFAGYGLDPGQSYPARLEAALRARGINARMINAGVSGDTTGGGRDRLAFTLDGQVNPPELAVISLGGNDMLRGLPPAQTRANLDAILTSLGNRGIKVVLLGMLAAPNLGGDYTKEFNAIYPAMAKKHKAALVPFFLQALIDKPELVQADRIHPTAAGIDLLVKDTIETIAEAVPVKPAG